MKTKSIISEYAKEFGMEYIPQPFYVWKELEKLRDEPLFFEEKNR